MSQSIDSQSSSLPVDTQELYRLAKTLIPGGTQLLSKRPELYAPDQWPSYYREAHGCEVVAWDGRKYLDMSIMGVSACLLGYNDPDVTAAVVKRIQNGSMCTLNNPEEVELAKLMLEIHPWAENVRYARTGGESMAVAVRIARAHTNRDIVAFCGYHGWHDWYVAANRGVDAAKLDTHLLPGIKPAGVPSQLAGTALPFSFNDLDGLAKIVAEHGDNLAAIVLEPTRAVDPVPGFHEGVRELADKSGAVMIFDEITIGWRLIFGGAHMLYGTTPDIAVFAKTMGNGHPIGAIIGISEVMQAAQDSFISSTYWTEGVGPTAALATLKKMQKLDVPGYVATIGSKLRAGILELAAKHNLPIKSSGHAPLPTFMFDRPDNLALQTLVNVRMLDHNILCNLHPSITMSHTEEHVDRFLAAMDEVFHELADAIEKDDVVERIGGPIRHAGFARLA